MSQYVQNTDPDFFGYPAAANFFLRQEPDEEEEPEDEEEDDDDDHDNEEDEDEDDDNENGDEGYSE